MVKLREKDQYYTDEFEGLEDDNFSSEKFNEIMTKFLKTDIRIDYESMTDIKKLLLNQIWKWKIEWNWSRIKNWLNVTTWLVSLVTIILDLPKFYLKKA